MNPAVSLWKKNKLNKKNRLKSCLVLICLVFAPIVTSLMFSESMMDGITSKYICLSDGHLQSQKTLVLSDRPDLKDIVYSSDEVVNGYSLLYSAKANSSCSIKGVKEDYFNNKRLKQIHFIEKDLPESNLKGITISRYTAKILDVDLGDRIALMIVPDSSSSVLRPVMVRVERIFYTGYDQLDKMLGFIDFDFSKTLYKGDSSVSNEILVEDKYSEVLDEVCSLIGKDYVFSKWSDHNLSVYRNFASSREAIFIVLVTIIVAASFYTASVAQQMIQDDFNDIAIVKLIGMDDSKVKLWAFSTVFSVNIKGIILGTAIGTALGYLISPLLKLISKTGFSGLSNYLLDFEISFPVFQIFKIVFLMIFISSLSIRIFLSRTRRIKAIQLFTE